ncbi:MAG: integrase core domain-containing protein, partial [Bacteroidales bacterium]|nr:integrase core domain-containing protein [Bacteroidales bacterium]
NNLVKPRKRRHHLEPQNPVFDPQEPNEIWSADFKGKFRMGNKIYCYPLTIADSYTRYVFCAKGLYSANLENTMKVFADVFKRYGLPKQIHTDNGQPFASSRALGRLSQLSVWFMELGIEPVFSDPARPDQNGRHERMHRELKGEATRPPGFNMQSQQRKLNGFVKEYNELRPHEALGLRPPEVVHIVSERKYREKVESWSYPKECIARYVCKNGAVRIGKREWLMISKALSGKIVGFEPVGGKLYKLYFRQFFLGYADLEKLKVYDKMKYNRERKL